MFFTKLVSVRGLLIAVDRLAVARLGVRSCSCVSFSTSRLLCPDLVSVRSLLSIMWCRSLKTPGVLGQDSTSVRSLGAASRTRGGLACRCRWVLAPALLAWLLIWTGRPRLVIGCVRPWSTLVASVPSGEIQSARSFP